MATQPEVLQGNESAQTNPDLRRAARPTFAQWFQSATVVLIALNVLVYAVMVARGVSWFSPTAESVLPWGADYGPLTLHGQSWRMMVSTFLHFGIIHIAFNMFVLLNIGVFMERLAGRLRFVVLYLVCGLGGSAASLAWHPSTVSAGASGAIFGLYGALLGFLLRHRGSIAPEALASQRKAALTFIAYNVLYGLRPGVDMAAHLGGLAAGFVLGLFLIEWAPASGDPAVTGRNPGPRFDKTEPGAPAERNTRPRFERAELGAPAQITPPRVAKTQREGRDDDALVVGAKACGWELVL